VKRILPGCAFLLLAACGSVSAPAARIDDIARIAGMTPLGEASMPEGKREIRLWLSQGLLLPNQFVRLTYAHERWLGEIWRYWPRSDAEQGSYSWSHETFDQVMERCGCVRTLRGPDDVVCRVIEERAIDWESVALRLKQLDVAGLPDEPSGKAGSDVLEVEVRTGAAFHRVRYDRFNDSETARRAGQVMQMVKDLDRDRSCR
jgi:hypothetical protein